MLEAVPNFRTVLVGDEDSVVARYRAGESIATIAGSFGVSTRAVRNVLIERGVPFRPHGRVAAVAGREADVAAAYEAGASILELARQYGSSNRILARVLRDQGVTVRPRGRNRRHAG
jgi:uncharacterized protein (DUF433 family)